ncbi:HPr kinase/phosphorylase [Phyllobacterium myrsinacearum]|uniref:Serine kinase of HPr protein (Carbohydrate metabolism regulator) n=1 Tax=Phyllobacterium myrsinacearum TaxID=28101 RepID=A0A839EK09_9HYPH|nr:HPr kinase/phosphorylase [Phyllobacterium myrsinacearum]MBA8877826.1 serine kinase of HPr protein (carbohydrate metabolism regulator) [Phyllobacterium myrsinacearum]
MRDEPDELIHASAVIVGDRGVVIRGGSGSGKSSIVRALMDRAAYKGVFAILVSDDQCHIRDEAGRLLCTAPAALRGGLEVRGSGLHRSDFEERAIIHLVVDLVEPNQSVRFGEDAVTVLHDVAIAHLVLPKLGIDSACRAIEARLFTPQWKK